MMSIDAFEKREHTLQLHANVLQTEQERIDGAPTLSVSEARKQLSSGAVLFIISSIVVLISTRTSANDTPLPKFECHYRRELACAATFPDPVLFMIKCRGKFFRFF